MKSSLLLVLVAVSILAQGCSGETEELRNQEKSRLQGRWKCTKIHETHMQTFLAPPGTFADGHFLRIAENVFAIVAPRQVCEATYNLRPSKTPRWIDITITTTNSPDVDLEKGLSWPITNSVYKGIYSLDGDTLRICMGTAGQDRPGDFEKPEKPAVLFVYRRDKQ